MKNSLPVSEEMLLMYTSQPFDALALLRKFFIFDSFILYESINLNPYYLTSHLFILSIDIKGRVADPEKTI